MQLPVEITYEGLRETLQALAVTDAALLGDLKEGLRKGGEVIETSARGLFVAYGRSDAGHTSGESDWYERSAETFETRVRAGGASQAIVVVGQRRRSSRDQLRRRPNYGGLQVKHGLLPARTGHLAEVADILEREVVGTLRRHGF